jgi:hypothetical protein
MKWMKKILREIFGLFVDDGSFALAILLWLAVVGLATPHLNIPTGITGVILFAGLALILADNVTRYSRRKQ